MALFFRVGKIATRNAFLKCVAGFASHAVPTVNSCLLGWCCFHVQIQSKYKFVTRFGATTVFGKTLLDQLHVLSEIRGKVDLSALR